MSMTTRYIVVKQSTSAHCCFQATILDTLTRHPVFGEYFNPVAECFSVQDAQNIATILNGGIIATEFAEEPKAVLTSGAI